MSGLSSPCATSSGRGEEVSTAHARAAGLETWVVTRRRGARRPISAAGRGSPQRLPAINPDAPPRSVGGARWPALQGRLGVGRAGRDRVRPPRCALPLGAGPWVLQVGTPARARPTLRDPPSARPAAQGPCPRGVGPARCARPGPSSRVRSAGLRPALAPSRCQLRPPRARPPVDASGRAPPDRELGLDPCTPVPPPSGLLQTRPRNSGASCPSREAHFSSSPFTYRPNRKTRFLFFPVPSPPFSECPPFP